MVLSEIFSQLLSLVLHDVSWVFQSIDILEKTILVVDSLENTLVFPGAKDNGRFPVGAELDLVSDALHNQRQHLGQCHEALRIR